MKRKEHIREGPGALALLEEAVHLLRLASAGTLLAYYLGALPFVLALLFFWSDLSRDPGAEDRLLPASIGLALLFIWMKTWQTVFTRRLLAQLAGEPMPRWNFSRLLRVALTQTVLQCTGLLLLPLAAMILLPFGWLYSYYQSATVMGDGETPGLRSAFAAAWRQCLLWPRQNHFTLVITKVFSWFVCLNLVSATLMVPFFLKTFFGIETFFTQSMSSALNTTFFAAMLGLTWLCLDPLLKAVYVLRCFYGTSLQSGEDLRADLRRFRSPATATALLAISLCLLTLTVGAGPSPVAQASQPAVSQVSKPADRETSIAFAESAALPTWKSAIQQVWKPALRAGPRPASEFAPDIFHAANAPETAPPAVAPSELDRAIEETIHRREFTWRAPREKTAKPDDEQKGWFDRQMEKLQTALRNAGRSIDNFFKRIFSSRRTGSPSSSGTNWMAPITGLLYLLLTAVVCALAVLLFRLWQKRSKPLPAVSSQAIAPVPDLAQEDVAADQLPDDEWLRLARELLQRGELRLALRAFYLSSLAHLARRDLIILARFKSNRDYDRELGRRGHALPELHATFRQNIATFDRVWYGRHETTREQLEDFALNVERMRAC